MPLLKIFSDELRKRVESVSVPEIGRIEASTGIKVESVPLLKNCPYELRKRVESV